MIYSSKLSPQIQLMLQYSSFLPTSSFVATTGITNPEIWQVIIEYKGDLSDVNSRPNITIEIIDEQYAFVTLPKYLVPALAEYSNIGYIEFPQVLQYIATTEFGTICANNISNSQTGFGVTGKGTLVAFIDSGIDYTHPDFRNSDGTTRIAALWDQTISGIPPLGYSTGTEYSREQINEALLLETLEERLSVVPSMDTLGHGTAVAGITSGNGMASGGRYAGVAPQSELIVVKVGQENTAQINQIENDTRGPRNIEVMLALKYILRTAFNLQKPVSILIGLGLNEGSHDGTNILELYIDKMAAKWQSNIVVGTGNQANKDSHTMGIVKQDETVSIDIFIERNQPYYFLTLWKSFADDFGIVVYSPSGDKTEYLTRLVNNRIFLFGDTVVGINFSEPSPANPDEQILIFLDSDTSGSINGGTWRIEITGINILFGNYNCWAESIDPINRSTRFLNPIKDITLTIPSTAKYVTSVAASDTRGLQIATYSGRGYTRSGKIKPDLAAPGTNIMTTSIGEEQYSMITGTSAAAAFVVGAYSLLMEYGIVSGRDNFLYGERLKTYLLRNAKRTLFNVDYPNTSWGYGELCIKATLEELSKFYDN